VPPHVTVLYPFVHPDRIDPAVLRRLAGAVGSVTAFDVTLARLCWFGDDRIWLAPEPDLPFQALTAAVWKEFPDHPPYGGIHEDPTPHLTVGHDAPIEVLQEAADTILPRLPIRARLTEAVVMQGAPHAGGWHIIATLPLAATAAGNTA
jgi:hypothetical protein